MVQGMFRYPLLSSSGVYLNYNGPVAGMKTAVPVVAAFAQGQLL
jgi:hypothetical protein